MMKRKIVFMAATICIVTGLLQAATVIDRLQNKNLWYDGTGVPVYHNLRNDPMATVLGDPSIDDGYLVQDNGTWFEYRAPAWTQITSFKISYAEYLGWGGGTYPMAAYSYDSNNTLYPLPNAWIVDSGNRHGSWWWLTNTYQNLSGIRAVRVDGGSNNWWQAVGTIVYETQYLLGHLISADTVDPMANRNFWFDADTNTPTLAYFGNVQVTSSGLTGCPIGPDDGYDIAGYWDYPYWVSYKTEPGKYFGQINVAFLRYGPYSASLVLEYKDGDQWVEVPGTIQGAMGEGWSWFTGSYDLTLFATNQFRVRGHYWSVRVGTVDMKVLTADQVGAAILQDFVGDWLSCTEPYGIGCKQLKTRTVHQGTATVDGDLSDWAGAQWYPFIKTAGQPNDVIDAKWALRWDNTTNLLYLAVQITDTYELFTNSFVNWYGADHIEVFVDASNSDDFGFYTAADWSLVQQYMIGRKADGSGTWRVLADNQVPLHPSVPAAWASSKTGNTTVYEAALHPFSYFAQTLPASDPSQEFVDLEAGITIGFDVVVHSVSQENPTATTGYVLYAASGATGQYNDAKNYLNMKLEPIGSVCGDWGYFKADLNADCKVNLLDFAILAYEWLKGD